MLLRVFAVSVALMATTPSADLSALEQAPVAVASTMSADLAPGDSAPPDDTVNEFFPEERSLGDCLSSLPKPDCGSEARGGWRQTTVLLAILAGLAFIAWRIVLQSRKARS